MVSYNGAKHTEYYSLVIMENLYCHIGSQDAICQDGMDANSPEIKSSMSGNATIGEPRLESRKSRQTSFPSMLPCLVLKCLI